MSSKPQQTRKTNAVPESLRNSALHKEYLRRLANGRDMRIVIDATDSHTGVGKSTLAVTLAKIWDIHGWNADKATLNPRKFVDLVSKVPKGSSLILDEAEQAVDRRRSNTKETLSVGHAFATGRYRQLWGILTLPNKNMIDKRIMNLCDYWIHCKERGRAEVYELKQDKDGKEDYDVIERLSWPKLDSDRDFQKLVEKKKERVEGEMQQEYIHIDEFKEAKKNFYNKFRKQTRYFCVRGFYDYCQEHGIPISQTAVGEAVGRYDEDLGLSQQMVSEIVNSESFEEFYDS